LYQSTALSLSIKWQSSTSRQFKIFLPNLHQSRPFFDILK